jgi:hypothetical protein
MAGKLRPQIQRRAGLVIGVAAFVVMLSAGGCGSSSGTHPTVNSPAGPSNTQPANGGTSSTLSPHFFNGSPEPGPGNTK